MKTKTGILAAAFLALAASACPAIAARQGPQWYVNMKYAYSVSWPEGVFLPQPEAPDGSGRKFLSRDGKAVASVYGYDGLPNQTLTTVYNETLLGIAKEGPGWKVTHKSIRGDSFILQGTNGESKFYKKVMHKPRERQFVSFESIYPSSRSGYYDPLVSSMSGSLKMLQAPGAGQ